MLCLDEVLGVPTPGLSPLSNFLTHSSWHQEPSVLPSSF